MLSLLLFLATFHLPSSTPPNILWIVCEDISPTLSMYGDSSAHTPNLAALAVHSMVYDRAFAPVGVCAPSRSAIITGMHPTSIGSMHMRTGEDYILWGNRQYKEKVDAVDVNGDTLRQYAAVPPPEIKCFTEYLRAAGYYCTNNFKTDYQFAPPVTAWDENSRDAHWRNCPEGQPFFAVFNLNVTHESRLWANADLPLTVNPEEVPVPPYLPDNAVTRKDIARHYSNVELMDEQVGAILEQLKADGLYDNTIIFFYSDHGGPFPRQKREVYDSGLKVPFMVKDLNSREGERTGRLISFIDLAPTMLSLAGIKPPEYMEGRAFLGEYEAGISLHVFGSGDRFDRHTDRIRAVRGLRYLYIRNFFPELLHYKDTRFRKNIPIMQKMLELHEGGELDSVQARWFGAKPKEELYDCQNDPHNIHNLVKNPEYEDVLNDMRQQLFKRTTNMPDLGQIPEATLINMMWPNDQQPQAFGPLIIRTRDRKLEIGPLEYSIAYLITENGNERPTRNSPWQLYLEPIEPQPGKTLYIVTERLGYQTSEVYQYTFGEWPELRFERKFAFE